MASFIQSIIDYMRTVRAALALRLPDVFYSEKKQDKLWLSDLAADLTNLSSHMPEGATVYRTSGPLWPGVVVPPTGADVDRRFANNHPGSQNRQRPMVLVQWRNERSWEYMSDLRTLSGEEE